VDSRQDQHGVHPHGPEHRPVVYFIGQRSIRPHPLAGTSSQHSICQDRRNSMRDLFWKAIKDIQTRSNVNPIVTKDGRELEIEWYDKTLKDAEGLTIGLLSIRQDITERKQAEKEREKLIRELQEALAKVKT
jgi:hypothetical protein